MPVLYKRYLIATGLPGYTGIYMKGTDVPNTTWTSKPLVFARHANVMPC